MQVIPNSHFHSKPSDAHVAQTPHPAVETPPKTTNKTPAPAGGGGAPPSHTQAEAQQIKRARGGPSARLWGSREPMGGEKRKGGDTRHELSLVNSGRCGWRVSLPLPRLRFGSAPQRIIRGTHREGEAEDGAERLPVRKAPSPAPSHPTPNPCAEPSPPGSGAQR